MIDNLNMQNVKLLKSQQQAEQDHYIISPFNIGNKILRLFWTISWILLCRWTPKPLHSWRALILSIFGAKLGKRTHIYPSCKIWAPWLLEADDHAAIGPGVEVYNPGGIKLGVHSIISQDAYICGATHDFNSENFTYLKKKIIIEDYAWICARAIVLPNVTCKEGSVLGAGAVVSKDMEQWTIYAGNPAKAVKKRKKFKK